MSINKNQQKNSQAIEKFNPIKQDKFAPSQTKYGLDIKLP